MLHPYTLTPLSLESQSTEPLPERKYGASREAEVGRPRRNWQAERFGTIWLWHGKERRGVEVRVESSALPEITDLQSLELKHEYKGGGERGCCIP